MEYVKCGDDTIPNQEKMFVSEDDYPSIFKKYKFKGFNIVYGNITDSFPKFYYMQHRN